MQRYLPSYLSAVAVLCLAPGAFGQAPAKQADLVVFSNGESLTGELVKADSSGITFKSAMAGQITVAWGNIKELNSSKRFAVLDSKQKLTRKTADALVPQGTVRLENKNLIVASSEGPHTVPVAEAARLLDPTEFDKGVHHPPNFFHGYTGTVTAGATLVRATQDSSTYTGAVTLVRSSPAVDWLPARSRTTINFSQSYGTVSQAATSTTASDGTVTQTAASTILTNIYHADSERDQYFSPRVYAFGSVAFDHNFSESLQLQQAYGTGIGITLVKNARQQLDFRGNIQYEKQAFFDPSTNQNLIGSLFSYTYVRHLPKGVTLNEFLSASPAWNNLDAYSAHVNASLTFPVYHGFSFNVGGVDDYLNNAPVGSRKNSTQYTTGITYTIK